MESGGVFTTIRVQNGRPLLWDEHIQRLTHSCLVFGFRLPDFSQHLARISEIFSADALYRLTVQNDRDFGDVRPLAPVPTDVWVWLSQEEVDVRWAQHKIDNRTPHQRALSEAQSQGCFEALLGCKNAWVDGSKTGFVLDIDGVLYVPEGGLPSVTRKAFLRGKGWVSEWITDEFFSRAKGMWLLGSGIGMVSVCGIRGPGVSLTFDFQCDAAQRWPEASYLKPPAHPNRER